MTMAVVGLENIVDCVPVSSIQSFSSQCLLQAINNGQEIVLIQMNSMQTRYQRSARRLELVVTRSARTQQSLAKTVARWRLQLAVANVWSDAGSTF